MGIFNLFQAFGRKAPKVRPLSKVLPPQLTERLVSLLEANREAVVAAYWFEYDDGLVGLAIELADAAIPAFDKAVRPNLEAIFNEFTDTPDMPAIEPVLLNADPGLKSALSRAEPFYRPGVAKPPFIKVYDNLGQEAMVPREVWKAQILPHNLKLAWHNPDDLYDTIVMALNDGFFAEVIKAAERLVAIDPNVERSAAVLGIVQMQTGRLPQAEKTFKRYLQKHGPSGIILTNLAKVYAARQKMPLVMQTLQQAIQADPNEENGLLWLAGMEQERAGQEGFLAVLEHAAGIPGSWRPQLWLARHYLEQGQLLSAKQQYVTVLRQSPVSGDALLMISGDLGRAGHYEDILNLVAPVYKPTEHGPATGFNLLQVYLEKKDWQAGEALLHELHLLGPGLEEHLRHFTEEFAKLKAGNLAETPPPAPESLQISMMTFDRPLWYHGLKNPGWLLDAGRKQGMPVLGMAPLSWLQPPDTPASHGRENDQGRLSRGIPLYLAEALYFRSGLQPVVLMPVTADLVPVVFGSAMTFDVVKRLIAHSPLTYRYFLTGTLEDTASHTRIRLQLWDVPAQALLQELEITDPGISMNERLGRLEEALAAGFKAPPAALRIYETRRTQPFAEAYVHAYAQSLTMLLAARRQSVDHLYGERNIYQYLLNLVLQDEQALTPRLLLLSALCHGRELSSDVYLEFKDKMLALLERDPDASGIFRRLAPLVHVLFDNDSHYVRIRQSIDSNPAVPDTYRQWVKSLVT